MRGFLSDQVLRIELSGGWLSYADECCERELVDLGLGQAAEREARSILAESEPFVASSDPYRVGRKSDTEHSSIGPLAMCSPMYQALAEALAAFVAD